MFSRKFLQRHSKIRFQHSMSKIIYMMSLTVNILLIFGALFPRLLRRLLVGGFEFQSHTYIRDE